MQFKSKLFPPGPNYDLVLCVSHMHLNELRHFFQGRDKEWNKEHSIASDFILKAIDRIENPTPTDIFYSFGTTNLDYSSISFTEEVLKEAGTELTNALKEVLKKRVLSSSAVEIIEKIMHLMDSTNLNQLITEAEKLSFEAKNS